MSSWRLVTETGLASVMHANPMRDIDERTIRFNYVTRNALILGSNQDSNSISPELAAHYDAELVNRRSGGGAVFLAPELQLWVDISVPRGDRLFVDDVQKSFLPIGNMFMELLSKYSSDDLRMHDGALSGGSVARTICFAGLGPGEITFEGSKMVGISQRRNAQGSVFQCILYVRYPYDPIAKLLQHGAQHLPDPGYALGVSEAFKELSGKRDASVISELRIGLEEVLQNI